MDREASQEKKVHRVHDGAQAVAGRGFWASPFSLTLISLTPGFALACPGEDSVFLLEISRNNEEMPTLKKK